MRVSRDTGAAERVEEQSMEASSSDELGPSRGRRMLASIVGGALTAAALACGGPRSEGLDASKLPENVREDYAIFEQRCSKCHSLARPLGAGIRDDDEWALYVNRMRLQPGSGITTADQERILRFLRHHAAELRKRDEGRSSPATVDASTPPSSPPPPPSPPDAPSLDASRRAAHR